MRALAQSGFTEAQILERLRSGEANLSPYFQITDLNGNVLEVLPTGETGVMAASVQQNCENDIKGQLSLEMLPVASLRDQSFKRYIRPIFRMQMDDANVVAWSMGDYLWIQPNASIWRNDETWDVLLGDKTQVLDYSSPGSAGFSVPLGEQFGTSINRVLNACGLPSTFPANATAATATKTWSLTTPRYVTRWESQARRLAKSKNAAKQRRARVIQKKIDAQNVTSSTTFLAIANDVCEAIPTNRLVFNYDSLARIGYTADPTVGASLFDFTCSPSGMIASRVEVSINNDSIANRVWVIPTSGPPNEVNANTYFPTHPLRQANIGRYIDATMPYQSSPGSGTGLGKRRLAELLYDYERVSFDALLHPGIEIFDIVTLQIPENPSYLSPRRLWVRQLQFDLFAGMMSVQANRIY